jgi:predicted nucleotidyltransferase
MGAGGVGTEGAKRDPVLERLVRELAQALGGLLKSIVLYGSAARSDYHPEASDFNVILVLENLDLATLETLAPAVRNFVRKGHMVPRMFTPALIEDSADSFPIEFVDIRARRVVLHGPDPFGGVVVPKDMLRVQIEREIKEKLMRLREGYVMAHDSASTLRRLLVESYSAVAALFRGGLHLLGRPVPLHGAEVVSAYCDVMGLARAPFEEVARLRHGEKGPPDLKSVFARYYEQLAKAADGVDSLDRGGDAT